MGMQRAGPSVLFVFSMVNLLSSPAEGWPIHVTYGTVLPLFDIVDRRSLSASRGGRAPSMSKKSGRGTDIIGDYR